MVPHLVAVVLQRDMDLSILSEMRVILKLALSNEGFQHIAAQIVFDDYFSV